MVQHPHGAWIWNLSKIRPDYLARLKQQNCQRVYLKVFDGRSRPMFWAHQCSKTLIDKFHQAGIEVYGWGFHYGTPNIEAQVSAVRKALDCGIDGYILDLEEHIKNRNTHDDVKKLIQSLRPYVQPGTLGYTSFGHPGFHPEIPWRLLDDLCDLAFPQIYFEKWGFGSDEAEVKAALDAHKKLGLKKPILPIWGSEEDATRPAPVATIQKFLDRYPGSSVFRVPNIGQQGVAWNLNYGGEALPTPNPLSTTEKPTKALFRMQLEDTTGLVVGHLFLFDANNKQIFDAVASSGLPGYQSADDLWKRAQGPIPDLAGIELSTEGTTIESREINGLFFPVLPYMFENPTIAETRGGFGVYNDAGNPGTSGGIGIINPNTYDRFCALMENARKAGVSKMPLKVEYGGRSRAPVKPARALFKMQLANTSRMVTGHIFLFDANGKQIFDAVATSGLPGTQGADDVWKPRQGPIPNVKGFTINTAGINMPTKPGVNGLFFPIDPFTVRGPNGVVRGDFGVHFDANVPGSQGCIVIQNKRTFDRFRDVMAAARSAGIKQIPLEIEYPGTRSAPALGRSRNNQPKGISIHIGINRVDEHHYQGWSGQLNAAESDARAMQAIAAQQGFASQLLLTEQATDMRVRDAIAQAARELESGDILLLTYAGHGGQIPDFNNDEVDKLDESWVLYNRELLDDELNALFAQFKPGVRILVISDSCYSGSATRTPYKALFSTEPITGLSPEWSDTMRTTELPKVRAMPQEIKFKTYYANHGLYRTRQKSTRAGDRDAIGASVILLAACQENQEAQEDSEHGYFTQALLQVWNQGPFTDNYFEFYRAIVRLMPSSQSPDYRYTPGTLDVNFNRQIPFAINFGDSDGSEESNWSNFPETDWGNTPELASKTGCGAEENLDFSGDFVQLEA